jgi:hypothetical protein
MHHYPQAAIVYFSPPFGYPAPMVTDLTVKCDWRGCSAVVTVPLAHDALQHEGWRQENYGLFALHLWPQAPSPQLVRCSSTDPTTSSPFDAMTDGVNVDCPTLGQSPDLIHATMPIVSITTNTSFSGFWLKVAVLA